MMFIQEKFLNCKKNIFNKSAEKAKINSVMLFKFFGILFIKLKKL
jgi:hypothetical protein